MSAIVVAVSRCSIHTLSKGNERNGIRLIKGYGVKGDIHSGAKDQHIANAAANPNAPNLRQVHLIHAELHDELKIIGFNVLPGQLGENITTRGIDLLNLPSSTRIFIGKSAAIKLTGLRNPCKQINAIQTGLMNATLVKRPDGKLASRAGVMSIVLTSGNVYPGDPIRIVLPPEPHQRMEAV